MPPTLQSNSNRYKPFLVINLVVRRQTVQRDPGCGSVWGRGANSTWGCMRF